MKIKYPNYKNSIVNFANSLLKRFDVAPFHDSIEEIDHILNEHKNIVVLLFDGMATATINNHLSKGSTLRRNVVHQMTSVFPPTTVAATNGFLSGKFPSQTGWMGWSQYFKDLDKDIEMFTGHDNLSKTPILSKDEIFRQLSYQNIFSLIEKKNPNLYVETVWPTFKKGGASDIEQFFKQVSHHASKPQPKLIYGYWMQPDEAMHYRGVLSSEVNSVVKDINRRVERLANQHSNTLFLIMADHGLIDVELINIHEYPQISKLLQTEPTNESRSTHFYLKKGQEKKFQKRFLKQFQSSFVLKTKQEIIEEEFYGPGTMEPIAEQFIGDFVAVSTDKYAFDRHYEGVSIYQKYKGLHAGLCEEEMLISIIALNK